MRDVIVCVVATEGVVGIAYGVVGGYNACIRYCSMEPAWCGRNGNGNMMLSALLNVSDPTIFFRSLAGWYEVDNTGPTPTVHCARSAEPVNGKVGMGLAYSSTYAEALWSMGVGISPSGEYVAYVPEETLERLACHLDWIVGGSHGLYAVLEAVVDAFKDAAEFFQFVSENIDRDDEVRGFAFSEDDDLDMEIIDEPSIWNTLYVSEDGSQTARPIYDGSWSARREEAINYLMDIEEDYEEDDE